MNILLITTDQHRADTVLPNFKPNLKGFNTLRESGVTFTNAYTPIAQCSPARASLLTGLLPHSHGMYNNCHNRPHIIEDLSSELWTYTKELKRNGYQVGQVGKWHISKNVLPEEYGIDDYIPLPGNNFSHIKDAYTVKEPVAMQGVMSGIVEEPVSSFKEYQLCTEAISLMGKYEKNKKPWHIRVEFSGPHVPWIIPSGYEEKVDLSQIEKPKNFYEEFVGKPTLQKRQHRNSGLCSCYHDWEWTKKNLQRYYGYIYMIDEQIQRLLKALSDYGVEEETMVIFTSDHGELAGAHNRIGKGEFGYDELYNIPMIIRWPDKVDNGTVCDQFIMLHDIGPTILSAVGAEYPKNIHGRDATKLLIGSEEEIRSRILMEHHGTFQPLMIRILRDHKGKYIFNPYAIDEFYDLERDPAEIDNLIENEDYGEIMQQYRNMMLEEMSETDEKWNQVAHWFLSEIGLQGMEE